MIGSDGDPPPEQSAVPATSKIVFPEQISLAEGKVPMFAELTLEFSEIWQEAKKCHN